MTRTPNTSPTVSHGNCLDVLKNVEDDTYAAVVTDPPYGLTDIPAAKTVEALTKWVGGDRGFVPDGAGFMGILWDKFVPPPALWDEVFRTLKPGGHAFVFAGARTVDLMGMSLRLAGFEIRDTISWIRSDGMPKGQELSKAMTRKGVPAETAEQWKDFHSALKPAVEPIICAQKPLNLAYFNWHLVSEVHHALAGLLWLSLSNARRAEALSRSVNRGLSKECVSALVGAAMDTSLEKSEVMGMFSSRELDSTSWSIASSWSAILDALSDQTKMSTTSMRSSTTTVLKILNSLLAPITSVITTDPCECLLDGGPPNAMDAEKLSRDVHAKSTNMRNASVPESVIEAVAGATCSALASLAENLSIDLEVENSVPRNAITQGQGGNSQRSAVSSAAKTSSRAVGQDASVQLNAQSTVSTESSRPAVEPIIVARKPLDGTLIENAIEHGVGVLNIGACRVPANNRPLRETRPNGKDSKVFRNGKGSVAVGTTDNGRFPPNVILDESAAQALDEQTGVLTSGKPAAGGHARNTPSGEGIFGGGKGVWTEAGSAGTLYGDSGGASRFFYCAKAPKRERPEVDGTWHVSVKPLALMRWLVRLAAPQGSLILDPFAGSGTTGEACLLEGQLVHLIEADPKHIPLIEARLKRASES